jgi:osmotically-inducible protein OsmY
MPNRQQNYQSGPSRSGSSRSWDDDDNRSARNWDRDYGQFANDDEGSSAGRAGGYDESRMQYGRRRDTGEESGSTGRYAGYGNFGQGDYNQPGRGYSGQDRYGQTGYGQGGYGQGSYGQPNYSSGQPGYGRGESEYSRTGSSSGVGYRGFGTEGSYGGQGGWREPSGEGQQYGSGGGYSQGPKGQHRGKGPKNYQRSDERVKEMLCERLHDDPDIDASEVTVSVQGGKIMLEGTVDSRRTKNAIEDVAEQFGSLEVQNNLRVQKAGERSGMEASARSSPAAKSSVGSDDADQAKLKRN